MLGNTECKRIRGQQKMRWLDNSTDSMDMSLNELREMVKEGQGSLVCCCPWHRKESDTTWQLNNNNAKYTSTKRPFSASHLPHRQFLFQLAINFMTWN